MPKENNKVDINKHEIDIDTLFKQNVNDLTSIKELYRKLKEVEEKITQIKYIDINLANKLKKEYENLKKIILDENIQAKLANDIETIIIQLDTNTSEINKIKTFEVFPNDEILNSLPINSTFEVKGFYVEGDMPKTMYQKVSWSENSIQKTGYCIKPSKTISKTVFLPSLGIRTGSEHAISNSSIISNMNMGFGTTLELPEGDYYFDRPISLREKQGSIRGACASFTTDTKTTGLTWLYFPNLQDGESAITMATGSISNVIIKGNVSQYNYTIDRSKTYIDKDNLENETYTIKTYGLKGGSTTTINNVYVSNFYYGAYLNTGNIYINNFFARKCHYGLSIGNDTKCMGVFGYDVHTLLQIRGSLSSAVQVRGDSVHHLINICGANTSGVHLTDLDGDFCIGSVMTIGERDVWGTVSNLVINGITGRFCAYNAYDKSVDGVPTSNNITDSSDISNWAFISVYPKNNLNGAYITTTTSLSSNLMDKVSNYYTPPILMAGGENCKIIACINTMYGSYYDTDGSIKINRELLLNTFKFFSSNANNTRIAINTPSNVYYYHKLNPNTINITRGVTESLS